MRLLACLLIVLLVGCKSQESIDLERANMLKQTAEAVSDASRFRIERCERNKQHSLTCAGMCGISKFWHKKKWN